MAAYYIKRFTALVCNLIKAKNEIIYFNIRGYMLLKYCNKGVALFISLALLFLLSIGAVVVLLTAYNYANVTENQIKRLQAISLAEAGVNYAYWKIRIGKDDNGDNISYPCTLAPPITLPAGYVIQVDITEDASTGKKTIRSKITY